MSDGDRIDPNRASMDVDIVCAGFGPAAGGFLTTLAPAISEFAIAPQVICYERADGLGYGVSGVVTKARGIRHSFPTLDPSQIPMAAPVRQEKVVYLFDPVGASRRSKPLRFVDALTRRFADRELKAVELPWTPSFLHKQGGLVLSIGQFNQWVSEQLMMSGAVQVWPGMPVAEPLIDGDRVIGVRLADQNGQPGMDIRAALTVVADGPVGPVGRRLDEHFGTPPGFERKDWAVGSKMVFDLPEGGLPLEPGTVIHTLGYPEPEIFGFFYVHPDRIASAGIFIPSWFANPLRTSYRYLQHFIQHPYLWRYLSKATMRSWGAKSIQESGRRGTPYLVGNGYARIGEGSGSTNVLTGSGVDEAWTTGALLADGVVELLRNGLPFTQENLDRVYVERRRRSWVEQEGRAAENSRNGFQRGFLTGLAGMGLAGITNGVVNVHASGRKRPRVEEYFSDRIPIEKLEEVWAEARNEGVPLHDRLMDLSGWPRIQYDGRALVTHQDALLMGGKVQGAPGFEDHVRFLHPELCETCMEQSCVDICSGQAIMPDPQGGDRPTFDREKCVHCGACLWNCDNIAFQAGGGGLHSAEN
jgi:electron-transferring-flavoprotein dehydrogenase